MNIKRALLIFSAVASTGWLAAGYLTSSSAQEKQRTTFFQSGGDNKSTSSEMKQAEIDYVKALLKVAQADLAKVKEANSKVPDTIPNSVVRSLENEVAEAEGRVKAMDGDKNASENPYVSIAQQSLGYAQQSLKSAQDANARAPGAVSAGEVQRRQAEVDVAQARLQMAKLLNNASANDIMEWQLLQLLADVHELRQQVRILQYRN